ncbi:hypothetical protein BDQ12DRAFT_693958 [Crucibulum laeve]|uniref:HNH nuclease domain-containing protein n=1 Tax=Crucibulum laeve TaxID=68775 RepID=A0A5C3LF96_9AGAR|nr:hypothetical protein BDQ12DRAFT_693958 [Crucibulum laeve]
MLQKPYWNAIAKILSLSMPMSTSNASASQISDNSDRDDLEEDSDSGRFSQSSGTSLRCQMEDFDFSYMYEPGSSSPAEGNTQKVPPADDTPEQRAKEGSNVPKAARGRLREKAGSFDCLITGESYPCIQVAHIIPRTVKDYRLLQIEYVRGERYKGFHIHSSNNLVCLRSDIHGEFDGAGWCLIPEKTVLDELLEFCQHQEKCTKDHLQRQKYRGLSFMKIPVPRVFRYRFHPLESRLIFRTSIFRRTPLDSQLPLLEESEEPYPLKYIAIQYPYKDFFVQSHIDPLLAVINAGEKLQAQIEMLNDDDDDDVKVVRQIFDIVRKVKGTEEWRKEGLDYTYRKRRAAKPASQPSPLKTRSQPSTSSHSRTNLTLPSGDNSSGRSFGTGSQGPGGAPSATGTHRSKRKRVDENREVEEHDASEGGVPELIADSSAHSPASMSKISKDFQEGIKGERLSYQGDYNFVSEWLAKQTGGFGIIQEVDGNMDDEELIAYAKEPSVSWQARSTSLGRLHLS